MSQPPKPKVDTVRPFRKELDGVRFAVEARIAEGKMTVAELIDLKPGSVVTSDGRPGGRIVLTAGRVRLATAEAIVEDGKLLVRVEDVGGAGE